MYTYIYIYIIIIIIIIIIINAYARSRWKIIQHHPLQPTYRTCFLFMYTFPARPDGYWASGEYI